MIARWPKAELHVHLEGSVEPETLCELSPGLTLDEVRAHYRYADFQGFLQAFKWVSRQLRGPEDYARITRRLLARLREENVVYAEIILAAGVILWRQQDLDAIFEAVQAEAGRSAVETAWIFDAVRQFGPDEGLRVAKAACRHAGRGVVGFGIGGDESRCPALQFAAAFETVRAAGLHVVLHAGETTDPANVWDAVRAGAERIGHGIRAVHDAVLLRHLARERIPLEICVTSNLRTGAIGQLRDHPLPRLLDAGVAVVLNTDDPAMFNTTLTAEYELVMREFAIAETDLREIATNAFRFAFRPQPIPVWP